MQRSRVHEATQIFGRAQERAILTGSLLHNQEAPQLKNTCTVQAARSVFPRQQVPTHSLGRYSNLVAKQSALRE